VRVFSKNGTLVLSCFFFEHTTIENARQILALVEIAEEHGVYDYDPVIPLVRFSFADNDNIPKRCTVLSIEDIRCIVNLLKTNRTKQYKEISRKIQHTSVLFSAGTTSNL
jgi:hypothetical protein